MAEQQRQSDELDVAALLMEPDATPTTPEPEATTTTETPATEQTTETDADPAKDDAAEQDAAEVDAADDAEGAEGAAPAESEKPKPGTPDKALQKLQQDLSAATRRIEELNAKVDAGEPLTPKEQQQQERATRSLDRIREAITAKGDKFDVLDHSKDVADSLVETDQTLTRLAAENAALRKDVDALKGNTRAAEADANWQAVKRDYAGVNVNAVWEKSVADTLDAMGFTADEVKADAKLARAVQNAASRTFHQRADAAKKSVTSKQPPAAPATGKTQQPKPTTQRQAPPTTPNGARVSQSSGVVNPGDMTEDAAYLKTALSLVAE